MTPGRPPSLSVFVVCRNHERFVSACLRSIIDAADQPIELVFLDNGSRDGSATTARTILRDSPSHITWNVIALDPEQPLCRALNIAHLQMSGEFIKLISADDAVGPNFFATFRELVTDSDPKVGVWLAGSVFIDDADNWVSQHYSPTKFGSPSDGPPRKLEERGVLNRPDAPPHSTASIFYRRKVWLELGGFDERFKYEDRPFLFEVLKRGWAVLVHPYNNTYYRVHGGGATSDSAWMIEARLPIVFEHARRAEWRNKPIALFHLARNVRDVAKLRWRKWKTEQ